MDMKENNINVGFEKKAKKRNYGQDYQLIFEVQGKRRDASTGGNWAGKLFYRLQVKIEKPIEYKHIKEVLAFQEKIESEEIWKEIENDDYFDKRKLATCKKYENTFNLRRWRDYPKNNGGGQK